MRGSSRCKGRAVACGRYDLVWVLAACVLLVGGCHAPGEKGHGAKDPASTSTVKRPADKSSAKVAPSPAPSIIRPAPGEAFFEMETILGDRFTFKLVDAAKIREAREILDKKLPKRIVGLVVKTPQPYNRPWHFHLDPPSVGFAYLTDERCDGAIQYLEDHLPDIGQRILPQNRWCPASSRLIRELGTSESLR